MVKQSAALAAIMKVLWQPVYSRGALGSCFSSACMRFLEIMLFCLSLLRGFMLLVCVAGCVRTRLLLTLRCQVVTTGSLTLILLALNFPPLSVTHYWKSSVCHKHQSGGEFSPCLIGVLTQMSFWTLEWTSAHIWACAVTNPPATCFSLFHRVIPYFKFGIHYSSFLYICELQFQYHDYIFKIFVICYFNCFILCTFFLSFKIHSKPHFSKDFYGAIYEMATMYSAAFGGAVAS